MLQLVECSDYAELSRKASELLAGKINSAKKPFSIAFPGGTSVKGLLENLASKKIDWQGVNAFMSDERMAPATSPESNYRQADELLFSKAKGIRAFSFDPSAGVHEYSRKFLEATQGKLDIVVLGVGEDGHVASLFPASKAIKYREPGYVYVGNSPKPPRQRISLSSQAIGAAAMAVLLFASDSKRNAFKKFKSDSEIPATCPAKIALSAKETFAFTAFGGVDAK